MRGEQEQPTLPEFWRPLLRELRQPTLPEFWRPLPRELRQPTLPEFWRPLPCELRQPTLPWRAWAALGLMLVSGELINTMGAVSSHSRTIAGLCAGGKLPSSSPSCDKIISVGHWQGGGLRRLPEHACARARARVCTPTKHTCTRATA